ncbi:MAG: hypothetical protein AB7D36_09020 [Oscillospiraceae bacterium]
MQIGDKCYVIACAIDARTLNPDNLMKDTKTNEPIVFTVKKITYDGYVKFNEWPGSFALERVREVNALMSETSKVYEDDYGMSRCGYCNAELVCDECGDMPEVCPVCGKPLDWSYYTNEIGLPA